MGRVGPLNPQIIELCVVGMGPLEEIREQIFHSIISYSKPLGFLGYF
jgi:hypothetical protein